MVPGTPGAFPRFREANRERSAGTRIDHLHRSGGCRRSVRRTQPGPGGGGPAGGGRGILDVDDPARGAADLADLARRGVASCWIRPTGAVTPDELAGPAVEIEAVVVAVGAEGTDPDGSAIGAMVEAVGSWRTAGSWRVIAQVTSRASGCRCGRRGSGRPDCVGL